MKMKMKMKGYLRIGFFLTLFINCSVQANTQPIEVQIDNLLSKKYKDGDHGAVILVAKKGKVIYRKAFGKANLKTGSPMTTESILRISSNTKQFTAVAILILLEQEKLSLDDPITKFVPDFPQGETITIHHLLTHTSGIQRTVTNSSKEYKTLQENGFYSKSAINLLKSKPLLFKPGEQFSYSDAGYAMLGEIIQVVSKKSYADFLENNIFNKASMYSTHVGVKDKGFKNEATGYFTGHILYVPTNMESHLLDMPFAHAAGSIYSTVDDMFKWQQALISHRLIKQQTLEKSFTNYTLNNGKPIDYGYGWFLSEINDISTIEHTGHTTGFKSASFYVPSQNVYVINLTNCSCGSPTNVTTKIAAIAIGKPYPKINLKLKLKPKQLKKWIGSYKFEDGHINKISYKRGHLYSQRESGDTLKLMPFSSKIFYFKDGISRFEFSSIAEKKEVHFKARIKHSKGVKIN